MSPLMNDAAFVGLSVCVGAVALIVFGYIGSWALLEERARRRAIYEHLPARHRRLSLRDRLAIELHLVGGGLRSKESRREPRIQRLFPLVACGVFGGLLLAILPIARIGLTVPFWSGYVLIALAAVAALTELVTKLPRLIRHEEGVRISGGSIALAGFVALEHVVHVLHWWAK